jgi:hypothetical protein
LRFVAAVWEASAEITCDSWSPICCAVIPSFLLDITRL